MQLFYKDIDIASLGVFRILGRATQREPVEAPQRERVTYRARLDFFQDTFTNNFTLVQEFLAALKSQNQSLLWVGETGAQLENRTVTMGGDETPEDVMSRGGTYRQAVVFSFWFYNHDVLSDSLSAQCFGLDMGAVEAWTEGLNETRLDDLRDARKRVEGVVNLSGRYQVDTTSPLATRQAQLQALKDDMTEILVANASGNLTFGTFNRTVRVSSFKAQVDQPNNFIAWTLAVTFTRYPDETNYSMIELRVQTRVAKPENITYLTLSGKIGAPDETSARTRLGLLTGSIVPAGYAQIINETSANTATSESGGIATGDGSIFTELTFTLEYRDTSSVVCTYQRTGSNSPNLNMGTIDKFANRYATTLFDEMRDIRRRAAGQVTIGGKWYVSDTLSDAAKQAALTARLVQLQTELVKGSSGTLVYGAVLNQVVRVMDFHPEIDRFSNCIVWSLTASYTAFPNEADYALCEFKLGTRNQLTDGTIFKSFNGEIWAPTAEAAQSKLARLRTALIPTGYTMTRDNTTEERVDCESNLQTTGTNQGDGATFIRLTIDEEWQATAAGNILTWNLRITTDDDAKTSFTKTTYSGNVTATAASQPTAFAAALAQAQTLGDGKLPFQLRTNVVENLKLFQTVGAQVFVTVDFNYEYQTKGDTVFMEVTSDLMVDSFGQTVESVSGYIAAPDLPTAQASYVANVRNAVSNNGALILSERTPTKSYQRLDSLTANLATLDDKFSFQLQLLRPKNSGQIGINYSVSAESNVQVQEVTTTIEGQIYSDTEISARAFLDTFLTTQTLPGKRTQFSRTPEYKQAPGVGGAAQVSVFVALKFKDVYVGLLTGTVGILESEVTEDIQYSGNRNLEKPIPDGNSIIQQVGIVAGRHTINCRAVSTTATAAQAWLRTIRTALLVSVSSSAAAFENPPSVRTVYAFLPQVTGIVSGPNVNVRVYEVTATFSEIIPDFGFQG